MRVVSQLLDGLGQPTRSAVIRYTEGDCWLLAYKTGLLLDSPLVAMALVSDRSDWVHLAVDLGRESLLDVFGVRSREETRDYWSDRLREPIALLELGRFESLDSLLEALDDTALGLCVTERDERDATAVATALAGRFSHLLAFSRGQACTW